MKDISAAASKQLESKTKTFENMQGQVGELQSALEKAWQELAEQKKLNATAAQRTASLVQEAEERVRQEYQQIFNKQAKETAEREASYAQTIQELRLAVQRSNERAAWREQEFAHEIQVLFIILDPTPKYEFFACFLI